MHPHCPPRLPGLAALAALAALVALLATAAAAKRPGSRYHSARCIAVGRLCGPGLARQAGACIAGRGAFKQPRVCVQGACMWCALRNNTGTDLCKNRDIKRVCRRKPAAPAPPAPRPGKPAARGARRPAGSCTWQGNDQVVISLGRVAPVPGWTPVRRGGLSGLVFRKGWGLGMAPPGKFEMCFPVRVRSGGSYFLTMVSYSPARSEHNDAWVRSSNLLRLWKIRGSRWFDVRPGTHAKAFQNHGPRHGLSHVMKNKDRDGHRFTVLGVRPGVKFTVCVSGRSFRFEVFRLVLKKCAGRLCKGGNLFRKDVLRMPVSQCS